MESAPTAVARHHGAGPRATARWNRRVAGDSPGSAAAGGTVR